MERKLQTVPSFILLDSGPPSLCEPCFVVGQIAPTALSLAGVALIEQLMTQDLVNEMTKTTSNPHREAFGLGVGNLVVGLFGGMGGNAMIGQSVIQVRMGGSHRISNIVVGVSARDECRSTERLAARQVAGR